MFFLYNLLLLLTSPILELIAIFSPKIKLFVVGRRTVFQTLASKIKSTDQTIWFHAASLGEFEQGLPVIEKIKVEFPQHKIIVTFFSPSGYEVRKNNSIADVTVYLPLDTKSNALKFLNLVYPDMVFFIKYEYWPNYLNELKKRNIKTYLISGIFRENQAFFKWYGSFYRKSLSAFTYFFVQNERSKSLLEKLGFSNVKISGDTRFDRVASILERDNSLDFIEQFKANFTTIVIGSSWPKDETLLVNYINQSNDNVKYIIAPHNIKEEQIINLKSQITKKSILFSKKDEMLMELPNDTLVDYNVFIIDTVGLLTKIYSYADIAYVGGGFGNPGVHNLLEPATFGIPIVLGPHFTHFAEAEALVKLEGCISIKNQEELNEAFSTLIQKKTIRHEKGQICANFVQLNKGATSIIINQINKSNP